MNIYSTYTVHIHMCANVPKRRSAQLRNWSDCDNVGKEKKLAFRTQSFNVHQSSAENILVKS